jgi:type I restriction enzyme M protein
VFNPYTGIKTNVLFFTKKPEGEWPATKEVWFYEHPYPEGVTSYNKTRPMQVEEFALECAWWGSEADGFKTRVENAQAWRVSIDQIKAGNFNLDLKNPHKPDTGPGDVDQLLPEYEKLLEKIAATRNALKNELQKALSR